MKKLFFILFASTLIFSMTAHCQIDSAVAQAARSEARKETALSESRIENRLIPMKTIPVTTRSTAMINVDTLLTPIGKISIITYDLIVSGALGSKTAQKTVSVENKGGVYKILPGVQDTRSMSTGPLPAIWRVITVGNLQVLQVGNCVANWIILKTTFQQ